KPTSWKKKLPGHEWPPPVMRYDSTAESTELQSQVIRVMVPPVDGSGSGSRVVTDGNGPQPYFAAISPGVEENNTCGRIQSSVPWKVRTGIFRSVAVHRFWM